MAEPLARMLRHSLQEGRTELHGRLSELALEEALIQVRLVASDVKKRLNYCPARAGGPDKPSPNSVGDTYA